MAEIRPRDEQIIEAVTAWPGVEAGPGDRGSSVAFRVGRRELGHLHGDRALHTGFPREVFAELKEQGRIDHHPVFPGKPGPASRRLEDADDVREAIELLRLNYDRVVATHGLPSETDQSNGGGAATQGGRAR